MKVFHIISSVVVAIAIFIVGFSIGSQLSNDSSAISTHENGVRIMIDDGSDTLKIFQDNITIESSLFDSLMRIQDSGDIVLTYEDYGGDMGVFLQAINGIGVGENSGNKWWHYWVNGSYAQVGVSTQTVRPGDIVLFKYMPAQESAVKD